MAENKVRETPSMKCYIGCGNAGLFSILAAVFAILIHSKCDKLVAEDKADAAAKLMPYFWVAIGLSIAAFVAFVVLLVLGIVFGRKEKGNRVIKPKIAGKNAKRHVYVVAGAIIKDGYVFAAQRGNKGETKFKWEFPGGKIEPHETPKEALVRELQEELKIKVKVHERITNIVDEYPTQVLHIDTYRCELLEGKPTLTEHIDMAWSNKEELDKLEFSPADAPTLDKIKKLYL